MCDTLFNQTEKNIVYCIYIYWLFSSENVLDQICDNDVARKLNSKSFYYLVFYPEAELWKFTWNLVGHTIQYMTQQCDKYHLPSTKHRLCVGGRYKCYFKRFVFFFLPCNFSFTAIVRTFSQMSARHSSKSRIKDTSNITYGWSFAVDDSSEWQVSKTTTPLCFWRPLQGLKMSGKLFQLKLFQLGVTMFAMVSKGHPLWLQTSVFKNISVLKPLLYCLTVCSVCS